MIHITECPRDAMQGIKTFIPTEKKALLINQLLHIGFSRLDFGSFVSPKAIPQLADTEKVLELIDPTNTPTELLAIIGNYKGAERAANFPQIKILGYPFSVSADFLRRNINTDFKTGLETIEKIANLASKKNQETLVYLTMALGNPYGEEWSVEIVLYWMKELYKRGIRKIAISDTIGVGNHKNIEAVFKTVLPTFTDVEIGFHLHTTPSTWHEKVDAAFKSGCTHFDTVMNGLGGCPMSGHEMTANLQTRQLLDYLDGNNIKHSIDIPKLYEALATAITVFPTDLKL